MVSIGAVRLAAAWMVSGATETKFPDRSDVTSKVQKPEVCPEMGRADEEHIQTVEIPESKKSGTPDVDAWPVVDRRTSSVTLPLDRTEILFPTFSEET